MDSRGRGTTLGSGRNLRGRGSAGAAGSGGGGDCCGRRRCKHAPSHGGCRSAHACGITRPSPLGIAGSEPGTIHGVGWLGRPPASTGLALAAPALGEPFAVETSVGFVWPSARWPACDLMHGPCGDDVDSGGVQASAATAPFRGVPWDSFVPWLCSCPRTAASFLSAS